MCTLFSGFTGFCGSSVDVYWWSIPFYYLIFHFINGNVFIYPFACWRTFGLFPGFVALVNKAVASVYNLS